MSGTELRKHPAQTRCLKTANMAGTQSRWLHVEEETLVNAAAPNFMARPEGLNKHEIIKVLRQTGGAEKGIHAQWPLQELSSSPQGPEEVHDIRGDYGVSCQSVHTRRSLPVN